MCYTCYTCYILCCERRCAGKSEAKNNSNQSIILSISIITNSHSVVWSRLRRFSLYDTFTLILWHELIVPTVVVPPAVTKSPLVISIKARTTRGQHFRILFSPTLLISPFPPVFHPSFLFQAVRFTHLGRQNHKLGTFTDRSIQIKT